MVNIQEKIWNEKYGLILVSIFCFIVHMVLSNQFVGWFCGDIQGYWSHAATLTGLDWSGVLKDFKFYYSWGYSIPLLIPFLLSSDVLVMYKIAIVINALFCVGILNVSYFLTRKLYPSMHIIFALLFSLSISVYTSVLFMSTSSLAECFLYLFIYLNLFFLYKYIEQNSIGNAILVSSSVGFTYIIHNRAIGVIVAYCLVVILISVSKKSIKEFASLTLPLIFILIIGEVVTSHLQFLEKDGGSYTVNTYEKVSTSVRAKFSTIVYGINSFVQNIIGASWYSLMSTFLIAGFGIINIFKNVRDSLYIKDKKVFFYLFILLSVIFSFAVSALYCIQGETADRARIDTIFYGRYVDMLVIVLLLFGEYELYHLKSNLNSWNEVIAICLFAIFASVEVYYLVNAFDNNVMNAHGVPGVLMTNFWPKRDFSVIGTFLMSVSIGLFAIFQMLQKKCLNKIIATLWIILNFILIGYNLTYVMSTAYKDAAEVINFPLNNKEFVEVFNYIKANKYEDIFILSNEPLEAMSYQVTLPKEHFISMIDEEPDLSEIDFKDLVVFSKLLMPPEYEIKLSESLELLITNDRYSIYRMK